MNKRLLAAVALIALGGLAHAEDYMSPTEERVRLSLGFAHYSSNTAVRVDSSNNVPGTEVNAEEVLGLDKSDFLPKFQAMLRVGERNRVRFDYFSLDRHGDKVLEQIVQFKDVILVPTDPVQSDLSMRVLGITYGYSFIHRERLELAATLGINETDISARARVETPARHVDQTEDAAGPIPTLGLDATWVISKRFYVDGRAQYLKVNVGNVDGSLGQYQADILYRLRPNIAFSMGYSLTKAALVSSRSGKSGIFDFNTQGPEFQVRIAF
jgi:hypothetical protein